MQPNPTIRLVRFGRETLLKHALEPLGRNPDPIVGAVQYQQIVLIPSLDARTARREMGLRSLLLSVMGTSLLFSAWESV